VEEKEARYGPREGSFLPSSNILIMIARNRLQRYKLILCLMLISFRLESGSAGNPDAKRLYDDLLSNYNKLVRPVVNVSDALTVKIKLKLSQLIDVVSIQV
jgi:hypothetical protein